MRASPSLPAEFDRSVVTTVHQGDFQVSGDDGVTYSTVLGSCIAACVFDRVAGVGGMNHFLLATQPGSSRDRYGASARYGAFAMEQLINTVLSRGSGCRSNLAIKVFGGGKISAALDDVGAKNIAFVAEFLSTEGYEVAARDLGGSYARRVLFKPTSGRAFVKRLDSSAVAVVAREEIASVYRGVVAPAAGRDIELF